jgi:hypothetical protein
LSFSDKTLVLWISARHPAQASLLLCVFYQKRLIKITVFLLLIAVNTFN